VSRVLHSVASGCEIFELIKAGLENMVTRSGTNLWHGDATFFTQNEHLNARNPEAIVSTRPRFRRYQPGVSLNGPIRKDRTFFSTAFEQEWESGEEWSEAPASFIDDINKASTRSQFFVRQQWLDFRTRAAGILRQCREVCGTRAVSCQLCPE
jgi:hypothetical protein